jgi:hypothetical protein
MHNNVVLVVHFKSHQRGTKTITLPLKNIAANETRSMYNLYEYSKESFLSKTNQCKTNNEGKHPCVQ